MTKDLKQKMQEALRGITEIETELCGSPSRPVTQEQLASYFEGRSHLADARVCFQHIVNVIEQDGE
jgi:hypothetical protein